MPQELHRDPRLPTPLWVTFESDPERPTRAERIHLIVAVLYPEGTRQDSLETGEARAVELARETVRGWLDPITDVGTLVCTVAQAGPGNLPWDWPHRLLPDGTKIWLTEGERS